MIKTRILALVVLIVGFFIGYFVYTQEPGLSAQDDTTKEVTYPFKLGLDLSGGTHLVYRADVTEIDSTEVSDAMNSLRDVIERRINLFGVAETNVRVQEASFVNGDEQRLVIELPGVTDIDQAVSMIGQTPLLEFKVERPNGETNEIIQAQLQGERLDEDPYASTELTGRYLDRAQLQFVQGGSSGVGMTEPVVVLYFDSEGADLFEELTSENIGRSIAIYLDGAPISIPVVNEAIPGGQATISGNFTPDAAKELVGRLNSGALPIPIELVSTQTIGASLGTAAVADGIRAGLIGLAVLALFFLVYYRAAGLVAIIALAFYAAVMFALFKLVPITLTAAGIAGFIISLGIAVDANILIFERMKEEMRKGRVLSDAVSTGFNRAWLSIRDSNLSSIITAIILFWFGSSLIQGFALTFGLGVLVSMLSAITVSRLLLLGIIGNANGSIMRGLFTSGFGK